MPLCILAFLVSWLMLSPSTTNYTNCSKPDLDMHSSPQLTPGMPPRSLMTVRPLVVTVPISIEASTLDQNELSPRAARSQAGEPARGRHSRAPRAECGPGAIRGKPKRQLVRARQVTICSSFHSFVNAHTIDEANIASCIAKANQHALTGQKSWRLGRTSLL